MKLAVTESKFWFVRHGESYKNVMGIHGGNGQPLTPRGIKECKYLVSKIQHSNIDTTKSVIVGHNKQQVIDTMNIFSSNLDCCSIIDERIQGIHLGVANGVSRTNLKMQFPNDSLMLDQWRSRILNIEELKVTNMEDVNDFYNRIIAFIFSCRNNQDYNTFIVVCTSSVMILLINLIVLNKNFSFKSYYHYNVKNGDYILANVKGEMTIKMQETSVILG